MFQKVTGKTSSYYGISLRNKLDRKTYILGIYMKYIQHIHEENGKSNDRYSRRSESNT